MPSEIYREIWYQSDDGLTLYARDYASDEAQNAKHAVICLHGLTRNSDDFSELCERFSKSFRMISADVRGRGRSDYDPNPENYYPLKYADDIKKLISILKLDSFSLLGTSMGGIISMLIASENKNRVESLILNDIGPEVDADGLKRIADFVVQSDNDLTWAEALTHTKEFNESQYPTFTDEDWELATRQKYRETNDGSLELNYDKNISMLLLQSVATKEPAPDLWPIVSSFSHVPMLVIRGELSDILSRECVSKLEGVHPNVQSIEVPCVGHPPLLNESITINAIENFLKNIAKQCDQS